MNVANIQLYLKEYIILSILLHLIILLDKTKTSTDIKKEEIFCDNILFLFLTHNYIGFTINGDGDKITRLCWFLIEKL